MKLRPAATLLAAFAAFFSTSSAQEAPGKAESDSPYEHIKVLSRAMQLIRKDYVDEKKVSYRALMSAALRGMLQSLDPHSQYMEPENFNNMKEMTDSRFGGLGIHVTERNGDLIVVSPMEDSPAFKAGIMPGDQIIKIDGRSAEKMDLNEASEKLRGAVGTKISLTILRPATKEIKEFEMIREEIKVWSVEDAKILPPDPGAPEMKIGYVRRLPMNSRGSSMSWRKRGCRRL
jgi:carboxyl-terminal processing protease